MEGNEKGRIEAILFVAGEAVEIRELARALGREEKDVLASLKELESEYDFNQRGFLLKRFGDKVQLATRPLYAEDVVRLLQPVQKQSLSQAAMETLAVVAYRQPVTRAEVEQIRGVKCDYSLQSLTAKGLIREVGRKETIGRPILFGTTDEFLSRFGIEGLEELPPLPEPERGPEGRGTGGTDSLNGREWRMTRCDRMNLNDKIEAMLEKVQKAPRYTGGEMNTEVKGWDEAPLHFVFCFPDTYEIGMSHLGMKILTGLINDQDWSLCERCFMPWVDMMELMRQENVPLFSLETRRPLREFDAVGFTLMYEMSYSNVLAMLDMGGIPVEGRDRREQDPIVVAGGGCASNPEPISDFIDAFMIGAGEEVMLEVNRVILDGRKGLVREGMPEKGWPGWKASTCHPCMTRNTMRTER